MIAPASKAKASINPGPWSQPPWMFLATNLHAVVTCCSKTLHLRLEQALQGHASSSPMHRIPCLLFSDTLPPSHSAQATRFLGLFDWCSYFHFSTFCLATPCAKRCSIFAAKSSPSLLRGRWHPVLPLDQALLSGNKGVSFLLLKILFPFSVYYSLKLMLRLRLLQPCMLSGSAYYSSFVHSF